MIDYSVHFFIHIMSKKMELVVKDTIATNSVPQMDILRSFIKRMVASAMANSQQSMQPMQPINNTFDNTDSQTISTQSSSYTRKVVQSQQITASNLPAAAAAKEVDRNKQPSVLKSSSPFSNAFFDDGATQPEKVTETKSKANTDINDDAQLSFEDAFLEQDKPKIDTTEDTNTSMDFDYNFDNDEHDTAATTSTMWTRQRIQGLERTIANLALLVPVSGANTISLSKLMLANAQVIAQVELKFIIIRTACGVLCAVDQHAADERVALEKLEGALCNLDLHDETVIHLTKRSIKVGDILKATKVMPPKRIMISEKDMSTVQHHWSLLQKWKFTFEESEDKSLLITGLPSVCDRVAGVQDFLDFVRELGHLSGGEIQPPFVKMVLASNACRYAIMFGDSLTHEKCVELISSLSKCNHCFICAHGRPSIIPLLDMNKEEQNVASGDAKNDAKVDDRKSLRFDPIRRVIRR